MNLDIEKPYVIGVDLGGTNTVIGLVDACGNILATNSLKTQRYPHIDEYVAVVCQYLTIMVEANGGWDNVKGMGIDAPNGNYFKGTIESAPNLPWKGIIPLAQLFQQQLGIPVRLTNDANAAALGEMTYGAAKGMKDFIMITLGTGVGSGIVVNGQLLYGHDGLAGELGHVIVERNGRLCECGRRGCLETYCSATGIVRTARERLIETDMPSLLRKIQTDKLISKDIYDAAVSGDFLARDIFRFTGRVLGESLANFIAFSNPEAIVLFGGLAKAGDYLMHPLQEAMEANTMPIYRGKTKLLFSQLKDADAAILGASSLIEII